MSQTNESSEPENELCIFRRVSDRLGTIQHTEQGYKVHTNTNLASALDKLAGSPFASFILDSWANNHPILVKGEDAGTWRNPDVGVYQKHATPSPFGRGEETVRTRLTGVGRSLKQMISPSRNLMTMASNPSKISSHLPCL